MYQESVYIVESDLHFLYIWTNCFWDVKQQRSISRICFGITSDLDRRRGNYEGHVGHLVEWSAAWSGPKRLIQELEHKIKQDFRDHIWAGFQGARYEWLSEEIPVDQLINWVCWEVGDISTVSRVI
jgi:hypothetical protein